MSRQRYTKQQIADALAETKGMVTIAARKLGCTTQTVYNYIERYPELAAIRDEEVAKMGDAVELALYDEAVNKRNTAALIFLAKTRFKDRGYTERTEHTGKDGGGIELVVKFERDGDSIQPDDYS